MPHEHIPVHANRRAVPTLFHIFPARPSHASSFTLPPAIGYRVRTPRRCSPKGSSEAAFCGVFQCRRGGASRWARPRRLSAGFSNGGAARSAAVPFCPSLPRRPGNGCRAPVPAHANRRAAPSLFHFSEQQTGASGRRPRTAHSPCSCARLLLFAAAPAASLLRFPPRFAFRAAHSCARVPSAPVSSVPRRLVPRRRALYPALFLRGRTHRAVLSPFPSHAARLSCPVPPVRPACAHRVEVMGEAPRPHARPALKQRTRNRRPASASPRARPVCPLRARPGHPCCRAHPGRPCRRAPPFASVRIPPCRRAPFFSIARQESERKRRILYEHMFV